MMFPGGGGEEGVRGRWGGGWGGGGGAGGNLCSITNVFREKA